MSTINRIKTKSRSELSLIEVLHALADLVRLEIVRQLDESGEKACGLFVVDMPKSSLSHHFRVLRKSGVIVSETQGTIIMNRLQRKDLDARFPGLLKSILAHLGLSATEPGHRHGLRPSQQGAQVQNPGADVRLHARTRALAQDLATADQKTAKHAAPRR
jgi:DNA-binding transcriptional ArsR family regulator